MRYQHTTLPNGIKVAIDCEGYCGPVDHAGAMLLTFGRVAKAGDENERVWTMEPMNAYGELEAPRARRTRREAIEDLAARTCWYTPENPAR